jgi:hypothetical protein
MKHFILGLFRATCPPSNSQRVLTTAWPCPTPTHLSFVNSLLQYCNFFPFVLRQGLTVYPRLVLAPNTQSSCIIFQSAEITGGSHHIQLLIAILTTFHFLWINQLFLRYSKSAEGRSCHVWNIEEININICKLPNISKYIYVHMLCEYIFIHAYVCDAHIILYMHIWLKELRCHSTCDSVM